MAPVWDIKKLKNLSEEERKQLAEYNRKVEEERKIVEKQLAETAELILKAGGIPWKPDVHAQKRVLELADPNYVKLMNEIKKLLDPNNILNPGKWEK